ncbi:aldehyde dehydrogenase [Meredithblackwellia eburnea MCA 4105]
MFETRHWINGAYVEAKGAGKTFEVVNPANREVIAVFEEAGQEEVEAAVKAGEAAQPAWAELSGYQRAESVRRFAALLRREKEKLALIEAKCMGKPAKVGEGEIESTAEMLDHFASLGCFVHGESSTLNPGFLNLTVREPFGVVAGIIPWNGPVANFCWKVGPAIVAGNAILLKSSEKAPLTSLLLGPLLKEAGVPDGIVNILSGGGLTGQLLSEHMRIRKIGFTGSTRTGRLVQQAATASNLKNVTLELGGKSPLIIFDDADLEKAVPAALWSIQYNSGQICVASTRLYVHAKIFDSFVNALKDAYSKVVPGDPTLAETTHGPQADEIQYNSVLRHIKTGKDEGATVVLGGEAGDPKGYFIHPTIFTNVKDTDTINVEEVFGPVLVIHKFANDEDAVRRANDTEYGLFASLFTQDVTRAVNVARKLQAGGVGVNCTSPAIFADMPFGGYKSSGIGRELGKNVLENWLEVKSVYMKV